MANSAISHDAARANAYAIVSAWQVRRKRQAARSSRLLRRFHEAGQWDRYAAALHLHMDEFADLYGGTPRARRGQAEWSADRTQIQTYVASKAASETMASGHCSVHSGAQASSGRVS